MGTQYYNPNSTNYNPSNYNQNNLTDNINQELIERGLDEEIRNHKFEAQVQFKDKKSPIATDSSLSLSEKILNDENIYLSVNPVPFKAFGKVIRTTNEQLSLQLKSIYSSILHDLVGVNIVYQPQSNSFITEFFFKKNPEPCPPNKITSLKDLVSPSKDSNNLWFKKQILENRSLGSFFTLNDETKILLGDLVYGGARNARPSAKIWNQNHVITEYHETKYNGFNYTYGNRIREFDITVRVSNCFDIKRVLSKIFGASMVVCTNHDNDVPVNTSSSAGYEIRFIKTLASSPFVYYVNVEQFDKDEVQKLLVKENPSVIHNSGGLLYY